MATTMAMQDELKAALARAVPMVLIRTSDQPNCSRRAIASLNGSRPVLLHDVVRGLTACNEPGEQVLARLLGDNDPSLFADPMTALAALSACPDRTVTIFIAADRWLSEPRPACAAMLLRDSFKARGCALVLLGSVYSPASELGSDVHVIDDALPLDDQRKAIVESIAESASITLDESTTRELCTYTRGLTSFAVEQTCALSASKNGFDLGKARRTWTEAISATPGLSVLSDRPTLSELAGLDALKSHLALLTDSEKPFDSVVFVDEIEKILAGASGQASDSSGASQAVFGKLLSHLENNECQGIIALGPPGTGKSYSAKVAGSVLSVPSIALNPGDCKGSLVGETERNATRMFQTLSALAGNAYWIVTCNSIATLPPELFRRFTDGIWFFDLPNVSERTEIWNVHLKKCGFKQSDRYVADDGWTGADIRNVCRKAKNARKAIDVIAKRHVPSSRASASITEALRRSAVGTFYSASYDGAYRMPKEQTAQTQGRSFNLGE